MKKSTFFVVAFALALVSCGSSKQQQQYPNYGGYYPPQQYPPQYQQYPPQYQQYPQQQQGFLDPTQMKSNISQVERLVNEGWPQGKLRGFGEGRGSNKNMARNRAALNARNDIAATMKALVQAYMREYSEIFGQVDRDNRVESTSEMNIQLSEQVAKQTMSGAHIIFSDFERDGNMYEYEVCVELDKSVVDNAAMNQAAKQGIMLNAEKFREAAQRAWDKMAIEEAGYNPAVADYENQQQQRNMQMQQQQHNMQMQQQNMQMQQQNMQMRQDRQEHNQQMQQQRMQMRQERQQHNIEMEQQRMY